MRAPIDSDLRLQGIKGAPPRPWALFSYGFRPFFLGAGVFALLLIPWWAGALVWGLPLETAWPAFLWHGHEMLFGFIAAAIAGFLLTAVPSWTGLRGFAGWPLILLAGLWAMGRIAVATSIFWPAPLVAALDLAFLPALTALLLPPLIRARNRNTPLLAVLVVLWATDAVFYWGLFRSNVTVARHALFIGIDIVLLLVTVIGGRIVPAFTASALKQHGISSPMHTWRGVTVLAIGSMLAVTIIDLWKFESHAAGVFALVAAVIQAIRVAQWRAPLTLRMPIVWILHLAYLWLPIGLALKALFLMTGSTSASYYLHALTIGSATTMIMAVMTRASLGHTGRPLVVNRSIASAYGLLGAAAVVRVFAPNWSAIPYTLTIVLTALLWSAAFAIFLWVYLPILVRPRADGKPG